MARPLLFPRICSQTRFRPRNPGTCRSSGSCAWTHQKASSRWRPFSATVWPLSGKWTGATFAPAEGDAERLPELALARVRNNPSVIVAGDAAVRPAQQTTKTIPINAVVDDIVGALNPTSKILVVVLWVGNGNSSRPST